MVEEVHMELKRCRWLKILSSRILSIQHTGSFSSSGLLQTEQIRGSTFSHASWLEGSKGTSLCRECTVENTGVFDGVNSLYGGIVSGLTETTRDVSIWNRPIRRHCHPPSSYETWNTLSWPCGHKRMKAKMKDREPEDLFLEELQWSQYRYISCTR